jgi:glutaminyl-peptide cyclotransferase
VRRRFIRKLSLLARALASAPRPGAQALRTFDGLAALGHLERLVAIGPRPAGSPASVRARAYIEEHLRGVCAETRVLPFDAATPRGCVSMANVIGVLPGTRSDVIMLGGHYDTTTLAESPFVGANDGGSSAALLLQLAHELAQTPHEFTYWITFFDGEEAVVEWAPGDGLYGSRYLAGALQGDAMLPCAVIAVDMVGHQDLTVKRDRYSTPWLTDTIWATARRLGYGAHFRDAAIAVEDDHLPFVRVGVPAVVLIDFGDPAWHTADDTLANMSAASLAVIGDVVRAALPAVERAFSDRPSPGLD